MSMDELELLPKPQDILPDSFISEDGVKTEQFNVDNPPPELKKQGFMVIPDPLIKDETGKFESRYLATIPSAKLLSGRGYNSVAYDTINKHWTFLKIVDVASDSEPIPDTPTGIKIQSQIDHPNIPEIYGSFKSQIPYLGEKLVQSMEYIEGTSALDKVATILLKGVGLSPNEIGAIAIGAGNALQTCHDKNIIHRDVALKNLLINQDGKPYLTDFEYAVKCDPGTKKYSDTTHKDTLIQSGGYAAPEVLNDTSPDSTTYSTRSDIFAFGVCMYTLLTGHNPFSIDMESFANELSLNQNKYVLDTSVRIIDSDPHFLVNNRQLCDQLGIETCSQLDTIFAKVLEKDETKRYQSASDFALDLSRVLKQAGKPNDKIHYR